MRQMRRSLSRIARTLANRARVTRRRPDEGPPKTVLELIKRMTAPAQKGRIGHPGYLPRWRVRRSWLLASILRRSQERVRSALQLPPRGMGG